MSVSSEIEAKVLSWPATSSHPHRFGGVEFRFHTREIGHLHGNVLLDVPFPKRLHDELIAEGKAAPHHVLPESGWISFRIHNEKEVADAIALLRRSYEIAANQKSRQGAKRA